MRVDAIEVEGLRHAPAWSARDLSRTVALPAAPVGTAIADALAFLAAALDPARSVDLLRRIGVVGEAVELGCDERGMPDQVTGLDPHETAAIVAADGSRRLMIRVRLALDPPLYGKLREESARDPRVALALAGDPAITVRVGWLFTTDHTTASVAVHDLKVGEVEFPMGRNERPRWADGVLRSIGQRVAVSRPDAGPTERAARLLQATLAEDGAVRSRASRAVEALAGPPFGLGRLELVGAPSAPRVCFGPELVRARQLRGRASRALSLVEAALIEAPDVLIVPDEVDADHASWLASLTEGDQATLEQVFHLEGRG